MNCVTFLKTHTKEVRADGTVAAAAQHVIGATAAGRRVGGVVVMFFTLHHMTNHSGSLLALCLQLPDELRLKVSGAELNSRRGVV